VGSAHAARMSDTLTIERVRDMTRSCRRLGADAFVQV